MHITLTSLEEALGIRREIDSLEKRLSLLLGNTISSDSTTHKRRRHMSPASRAKIAAAARARWARVKTSQAISKPTTKRGGITPAGRRKLSQIMKARWAARRKAAAKK